MTLFEINKEYEEVFAKAVDPETGEILDEEAAALLNEIAEEKEIKAESIALFIKNEKADAEAIKAEKMTMARRQQVKENRARYLEKYLMAMLDGEKIHTAKVSVSYRKSEVVEIAEGAEIPVNYLTYAEPKPNKTELKKAIKAGQTFEGVSLVEKQNIQIK